MEEASGHLQVEVYPDNVEAVNVFVAMSTQWNYAGMGTPTGFIYASVEPVLRMSGIKRSRWPDVFAGLRTMEGAAIEYLREAADRG